MTRSHMNSFGYSQPIDFIEKMENLADAYVSYLQHASKPPIEPAIKEALLAINIQKFILWPLFADQ